MRTYSLTSHASSSYLCQIFRGNLSESVSAAECEKIAKKLRTQGWSNKFIEPLEKSFRAVRIGFALFERPLSCWVNGNPPPPAPGRYLRPENGSRAVLPSCRASRWFRGGFQLSVLFSITPRRAQISPGSFYKTLYLECRRSDLVQLTSCRLSRENGKNNKNMRETVE